MTGVSTLSSFVLRIIMRFGVNGFLTLAFIVEVFACAFFLSDNSREDEVDYRFAQVESVEKLESTDERLAVQGLRFGDDENYYLVGVRIDNYYSEDVAYMRLGAEDQNGEYISCTKVQYYGRDVSNYNMFEYIPAGTSVVNYYIINFSDYKADSVESIRLYDYNGTYGGKKTGTQKDITFALP